MRSTFLALKRAEAGGRGFFRAKNVEVRGVLTDLKHIRT